MTAQQALDPTAQELIDRARDARARAYAPYSHFQVGAALRLRSGVITEGVNVENASYGLTVCAERHAVAAAVLGGARPGDVVAVAVVADADSVATPCGACRQVLAEHADPAAEVILHNLRDGRTERLPLSALLPHAFHRDRLPRP